MCRSHTSYQVVDLIKVALRTVNETVNKRKEKALIKIAWNPFCRLAQLPSTHVVFQQFRHFKTIGRLK